MIVLMKVKGKAKRFLSFYTEGVPLCSNFAKKAEPRNIVLTMDFYLCQNFDGLSLNFNDFITIQSVSLRHNVVF